MALSCKVEKIPCGITLIKQGYWNVTLKLTIFDGTEEVFSRTFTKPYQQGEDISYVLSKYQNEMQSAIDKFKSEQSAFNSAVLDNAVAQLQSQLTI